MGKRGKKLWSGLGAIVLSGLLSACQTNQPPRLKIGTLLPVTGDLSQYGSSMQDSTRLLVNTVNACGGVLGQPVELIAEDDQTEPAAGASAMTKLAEVDRVSGVVGAASSAVSSAAIDIAVRNQVVLISPSSTSPVFTERAQKGDFQGFWWRTAPPDTYQGKALAGLAKAQNLQTVSVLAVNNDYGNGLLASFIPAFETMGGKVLNKANPTLYRPDAASFESEVGAAFRGNPDAVLLVAYPETGSLVLKAAYQQGLLGKSKILVTDGMKEAKIADLVGKTRQGDYIAAGLRGTAASARGPALKQFQAKYQAQYRRLPKIYDPNTWDAAALLVLAAELARSPNGNAIKAAIPQVANPPGTAVSDVCQALTLIRAGTKVNYQGASGNTDFNQWGDVIGTYEVWEIGRDGKLSAIGTMYVDGQSPTRP